MIYFLLLVSPALVMQPAPSPGADTAACTETFQASDEWRPIQWEPARIAKGSALDFSALLEAPAGKYGQVVCRGGRFAFQSAPDRPVRIYGVVISHALPYLDQARCEQLADYLAACGYNGVRLHNYTFAPGVMQGVGAAEFSPQALDQLDYFFYCLKQRGIYFTFPINSWGFFKAGDVQDVPEFRNRAFRFESNGLLPISADLQRWYRSYALHLLGHTNRYTGLPLKDEPALLSIELTNEDSLLAVLGQYPELVPLYRQRCREHLQQASGQEPTAGQVEAELPRFVLGVQEEFCRDMMRFLRQAGVRQPITDLNFRDNMIYALSRAQLDYVDIHAYWALYKNLPTTKPGTDPEYRQSWVNPHAAGWSYYLGPVAARLFGKPYVNSEFNGCYPCPYWIHTGPVEAALAGSQGWNAVFRCGLAAQPARLFSSSPVRRIETCGSPLMLFSERIGALLLAQGEVQPLPVKLPLVVTPEYLFGRLDLAGGPKYPGSYQELAFQYQLGTIVLDGHQRLDEYPCLVVPPDMAIPQSLSGKTVLRADATLPERLKEIFPAGTWDKAPRLELDRGRGSARIVTPRSETFLLSADADGAQGDCVRIAGNQGVAACFAGSLDGRPMASSGRMLVLYLTDLKNSGTQIEHLDQPKQNVIVRRPGTLPLLVRQGKITMTVKHDGPALPAIWALKYDGSRAVAIEPHRTGDGFSFEAQAVTAAEVFSAYELTWD